MYRGEIWLVNLPDNGGSIQKRQRPCVLISNNKANHFSPVIHACPITTQKKKDLPTHVEISTACGLLTNSTVLCEQTMLITKDMLVKQVGKCDSFTMNKINNALSIQFGLFQEIEVKNKLVYA